MNSTEQKARVISDTLTAAANTTKCAVDMCIFLEARDLIESQRAEISRLEARVKELEDMTLHCTGECLPYLICISINKPESGV